MADRVGQQLGNYRLIRLLGQGAFGEVYLGEHIYLRTKSAIKVLGGRLAQHEIDEFLQEGRTIAGLQHAHIVRVLDFCIEGGIPYLVMDYAPGGTLRERYPKGTRIPLDKIVSYVKQIAAGLQYAHERRLVHRDIKPENLLIGANGDILVSDFGIATVAHSTRSLQTQNEAGGTVPYRAPEQTQGKPRPASDQYALGIIVYEWLCGERPFNGSAIEVAMQHALAPPPPLRAKVSTIPLEVEQVVMTALAKDPKQRFGTVQAFATALEQASKPTPVVITTDWVMKGFDAQRTGYNPHEHILSPTTVPRLVQRWAFPTGGKISSSPAVANGVVYVGSDDKNLYALDASTGAKLWTFPTGDKISSSPAVANGMVYVGSDDKNLYALDAATGVKLWVFPTGDRIFSSPAVANGVVYVGSSDKSLYALDARNGTKLWAFPIERSPWCSPPEPAVANGVVYVVGSSDNLYALDASSGAQLWAFPTRGAGDLSLAVTNGVVYVGSGDKNLYALDVSSGAQLWSFSTGDRIYSLLAVANGVVYVGSADHNLYAVDANSGAERWAFFTGNIIFSSPAVANGVVYVGSEDKNLCALDASSGAKLWAFSTGETIDSSPAVANGVVYVGSHDGNLYAFGLGV